jgi:hypothetical protein
MKPAWLPLLLCLTAPAYCGPSVKVTVHDAITVPNQRVVLRAKFEGRGVGPLRGDLRQKPVRFRALRGTPTALTDSDGLAAASVSPVTTGRFPFTAELLGVDDRPTGHGTLFVIDPKRPVVVVDIDGTLSAMSGWKVPFRGSKAETFPGARALLSALARTHAIVYLSARDDSFLPLTRRFLALHEFPPGPVLMNDWGLGSKKEREQLMPGNHGAFKARVLTRLRRRGLKLTLGLGDADSDAEAYRAVKIPGFLHRPKETPHDLGRGCYTFAGYPALERRLREAGVLGAR